MTREQLAIEHEAAFIRSFIIREKRGRYQLKLATPKKRHAFLDRLNHQFHKDLDSRWVCETPPVTVPIGDYLCYIMASEDEFDGQIISASNISEILSSAYFGIIVSYISGRLAAYKDESPSDVVWLHRE